MARINDKFLFEKPRYIDNPSDCIFYHVIDLPSFGTTDGPWDLRGKFDNYIGFVDVNDKCVLDIGTATGFLTFEAEKRGAEVVSFDISDGRFQTLLPFVHKPYYQNHSEWAKEQTRHFDKWKNGYWLAHRLLNSQARVLYGNVHDLPTSLGMFDVAIVGSILEHLNDPISALASISRLTESMLVIVAGLLETEEPIARFEGRANNPDQDYTWWTYSLGIYRQVLGMLGFKIERVHKDKYLFTHANVMADRYTIVADRVEPIK